MRVLAADDDEGVSKVLAKCLHQWGYAATIVNDGSAAWAILKREDAPRLVVLDWEMPGLSGVEVCRLLRSTPHGAHSYVVMLTGKSQKEDVVEALESGADDFLSKPMHPRELQLRLAKGMRELSRSGIVDAGRTSLAPPSGSLLGGKYRLESKIADGGMATVWLGVHVSLGINVAIKFMAPELAATADYASFEREARAAAQLRNEHVVRIYDHGISADGLPYLVMEYLAGESLSARVARLGPLPVAHVVAIVSQVARALTEVHAHGIVHRDVKPDNILLVEDSDAPCGFSVKLIDFGLALRRDPAAHGDEPPVAGTPAYMCPEYLSGEEAPGPLGDLWGLATSAFVAMTGAEPYPGDTLSEVFKRVCADAAPVPSKVARGVPSGFDGWFANACARHPEDRYATAADLGNALAEACPLDDRAPITAPGVAAARARLAPTEPATATPALRRAP